MNCENKRKPILYKKNEDCCGCTACFAICPQSAIHLRYNDEGFLYPSINSEKCVKCFQCEKICSFKNDLIIKPNNTNAPPLVFAIKHKNRDIIVKSSSGGMFTALSDEFLNTGNAVASCIYNDDTHSVEMKIYEDELSRDKARGSKYIQAEIGNAFIQIDNWIQNNSSKKILVIGTGCQIAGLNKFLNKKKIRDNVLLVDLICHGATSSGLWKKYADTLEKRYRGKIEAISFKDKRNGWKNPTTYAIISDKEISIKPFGDWFYAGLAIRESCYKCPYTTIERNSDITIGDYWGIENVNPIFFDPMGVSLALIHTQRGREFFDCIQDTIETFESSVINCMQPRLIKAEVRPTNRKKFWRDIEMRGIEYCEQKYKETDTTALVYRVRRKLIRLVSKVSFSRR